MTKKQVWQWIGAVVFLVLSLLALWWGTDWKLFDNIKFDQIRWGFILAAVLFLVAVGLAVAALVSVKKIGSPIWWTVGLVAYGSLAALLLAGTWPTLAGGLSTQALAFAALSTGLVPIVAAIYSQARQPPPPSSDNGKGQAPSTVLMLWTGIVVFGISYVAACAVTRGSPFICEADSKNCVVEGAWFGYALLIGLPGAAAALAKRKDGNFLQFDPVSETTNQVTKVQYFTFNAVVMVYVVGTLLLTQKLAEIPDILLALTGASTLTYALVKPPEVSEDQRSAAQSAHHAPFGDVVEDEPTVTNS